jgi:hypothetical protein
MSELQLEYKQKIEAILAVAEKHGLLTAVMSDIELLAAPSLPLLEETDTIQHQDRHEIFDDLGGT